MKKGLVKLIAGALAGMLLLSGCDALPKGTDGPREVPQTITADFTKKEDKGNWVTYGDCKVTLKDGTAVVTERASSNSGVAVPCPDYRNGRFVSRTGARTDTRC